ncbi:hypothetical protein ACFQ45_03370 [Rhodanobacter aciditrophus]|uniref:Uncharacterized protein n=1 Tax=Rhodanobacter aciditrophus TaxID=1623218 RepID=A0ABW4AX18_9GAMM
MKILIRKKRFGSLSSLLFLTLLQPAANAKDLSGSDKTDLNDFEVKVYESEHRTVKTDNAYPTSVIYPEKQQLALSISNVHNYAYKQSITQAFTAYYEALDELEENYQESVDQVLDQYENDLKQVKLSGGTELDTTTARSIAEKMLATLKQERDEKRNELRMLYHIT